MCKKNECAACSEWKCKCENCFDRVEGNSFATSRPHMWFCDYHNGLCKDVVHLCAIED